MKGLVEGIREMDFAFITKVMVKVSEVFAELNKLYRHKFKLFENKSFLYGWTWWSLPPKMWREAKSLGFENDKYNKEWFYHNTITGYGDYSASVSAQEAALEVMREKYPDNGLLLNITAKGKLD